MQYHQLLAELDILTHDQRVQRMIALGHQSSEPHIAAVIAQMEQGNAYTHCLALQSCHGSRDGTIILRALASPSVSVRHMAFSLVARICDDAQTIRALALLRPKQQHQLLHWLYKQQRYTVIAVFVQNAESSQRPPFIPYLSETHLAQADPAFLDELGFHDWRRLSNHHPGYTAQVLVQRAQQTNGFNQRLLHQVNRVLPILALHVPDQAVQLVQAVLPHIALQQLHLGDLLRVRPAQIAALMLQSEHQTSIRLGSIAARLNLTQLLTLTQQGLLNDPESWFPRIDPALRQPLYEQNQLRWRDAEGVLHQNIVAALPEALRVAEARRHLKLRAWATRPYE